MGAQYCGLCHRWYYLTYASHNAQHIADDPHAFCRTIDCGQPGCPVALNKAEDERITDMLRDRYDLPVEGDPPDLNREGDPAWNGAFDRW